jgi:hypothetical protein
MKGTTHRALHFWTAPALHFSTDVYSVALVKADPRVRSQMTAGDLLNAGVAVHGEQGSIGRHSVEKPGGADPDPGPQFQ